MRPLVPALLLSLIPISLPAQSTGGPTIRRLDGPRIKASDAVALADRVLKENHVTGAELAVLNDGRVVWTSAFGLRDKQLNLPMTPAATTWAASITQGVFAVYVMKLVERGRLDLDRPIVELLDKPLDSYTEYRETATDLVHDPRWATVTPRILLSHTSGLANFAFLEPDKKLHLHYAPGTRFAYSGEGLNLLQFVVEQREKEPLDELMQETIFTPLGMKQTAMVWNDAFVRNVADRYDVDEKFIAHTGRDHARAAGSMTTSMSDLAVFASSLMDGQILPARSVKAMLTPAIRIDAAHQFPTFEETSSTEGLAVGLAYGLGWGLLTKTKFGPAFFKEGHGETVPRTT